MRNFLTWIRLTETFRPVALIEYRENEASGLAKNHLEIKIPQFDFLLIILLQAATPLKNWSLRKEGFQVRMLLDFFYFIFDKKTKSFFFLLIKIPYHIFVENLSHTLFDQLIRIVSLIKKLFEIKKGKITFHEMLHME